MEAEIDVLCVIGDDNTKQNIQEFLTEETRPLLDIQVDSAYRDMFNVLDNLGSVEHSKMVGKDKLALSWFIGGRDWHTETTMTLKDLKSAGADKAIAVLWLDGHIEHVFQIGTKECVEMANHANKKKLTQLANGKIKGQDVFDYLKTLI